MILKLKDTARLSMQIEADKRRSITNGLDYELTLECKSIELRVYYIRTPEGFEILSEEPKGQEYGTLEISIEIDGFFGGPAVYFREVGKALYGELLNLPRLGSMASMAIRLPEGVLTARDGVGDWTRVLTLSKRGDQLKEK